ncbi:hydroxysteroid dehydrogenase-like protein 2 [Corapipo altera]|uniref:hydroxysteroid dehydrogenase-like protein 2 n=1 Tax=Corapipo altera TaxID=415028 RepID=UPI000FD631F6|nr:hydroxysteroid dehydrogenase-like protein 2 [Corapipo altera]
MTEENVRSTQGVFQFELSGDGGGTWYIDLKNKGGSTGFGKPPGTADVVMSMSSADFVKMFTDKLKPFMAFMSGNSSVKGDTVLPSSLPQINFEH